MSGPTSKRRSISPEPSRNYILPTCLTTDGRQSSQNALSRIMCCLNMLPDLQRAIASSLSKGQKQ